MGPDDGRPLWVGPSLSIIPGVRDDQIVTTPEDITLMGTPPDADQWMVRALQEGARGPEADPNPRVGAVVLTADGSLAGVGHHRGAGSPHAEIVALQQAGERARGGTVYVTLEPCDHHGRTGPCSVALLDAGVTRVVYAVVDPSGAGGGASRLSNAGVQVPAPAEVLSSDVRSRAEALADPWLHSALLGRPRVIWKFATSLDGRVAAADGSSAWITSAQARADAHALRARCGAILVGTGTAVTDDPALTVRDADGALADRQPLRVVLGHRDLPPSTRLLDDTAATLQLRTHDPAEALAELHRRQVRQVLVEGGPTVAAAFWRAGLVDEVVTYLAPALLGAGATAVGDLGIATIADIARLQITEVTTVGPDVRITARPLTPPTEAS